jgi:hypothetical protein
MDFNKFNTIKEKYKDNGDLLSVIDQIESEARTLYENKESAVGEVKKFKDVKHTMAELLGLEKDIPANDLVNTAKTKLSEYQREIDSFKTTASSKQIEEAQFREKFQEMSQKMAELTKNYEQEQTKNKMNMARDEFKAVLSEMRITDPSAQSLAVDAYMSQYMATEDKKMFVKSIAEKNPYLTQSLHKAGAGTNPAFDKTNTKNLSNTPLSDSKARTQIIAERLASQGFE